METEKKLEPIQTVERAFQLLECISRNGSMSLADLHKVIDVNKASLLRLAYTLTECGYLNRNEQTKEYSLSLKMYEVGINSIQGVDKMSLINSVLADLAEATGRIAQFSIEDNNELICLQSIGQKTPTFSIYTTAGRRAPLYCSRAGKAILATYNNADILAKWPSFNVQKMTRNTITDPEDLLKEMGQIRSRQYALDMEENEYHLFCIGAVVLGNTGKPVGAISLSGHTMTEEEEKDLSEKLLSSVSLLSRLMGYVGETTLPGSRSL